MGWFIVRVSFLKHVITMLIDIRLYRCCGYITLENLWAYNRRSGMILVTCNGTAKVWRSISNNFSGNVIISIFTCRILETSRRCIWAEWNVVKINRSGKCEIGNIIFYWSPRLLISRILPIGSKLLNLGEILKIETFYKICGESPFIADYKN